MISPKAIIKNNMPTLKIEIIDKKSYFHILNVNSTLNRIEMTMGRIYILATILFVCVIGCVTPKNITKNNSDSSLIKYANVESLLKQMTLEEKIGQMNQYNGFWNVTGPTPKDGDAAKKYEKLRSGMVGSMLNVRGVEQVRKVQKIAVEETRLGIPLIFGFDVIHGYKTIAPIPLAESASWDMDAIRLSAKVAAKEAAASGLNWTFAPMVDISRDARWGRVMEGAGEDPYLGSKIAVARVTGFQGDDLSNPFTVAACAKHFAGYGFAESGRDYNTTVISGDILHNIVLPPFKACVDAGVATFMNGFNEMNGIPVTGHVELQREILKGQWMYEGMIVSDWGSISEMKAHGFAADDKEAGLKAVLAGSDMDMESYIYEKHLKTLVEEGKVDVALINDAARRILNLKQELGLFDDPYKYCNESREAQVIGSDEVIMATRDMARKSVVLLKNENAGLPIQANKTVAVIGPLVSEKNSPLGSWRIAGENNTAISVEEGLTKYNNVDWTFLQGVKLITAPTSFVLETKINEDDRTGIDEAVAKAKEVDQVIMVLGEHGFQSGEARSRTQLDFPGLQQELLEAVYAVNPNIVLIVMSGRPLDLSWADEHIPTIVQAWHLGTESGNALAEIIMGEYNPSGKLPMSFPRSVGQLPIYYNYKNTGRPTQHDNPDLVFWSHYMDEENSPLYPFGHGESYTTFEYSNLNVTNTPTGFSARINVKNTGTVPGEEVTQLYIRDISASMTRPVQELKGFEKNMLKPGENKTITFNLTDSELGFYDNDGMYHVEDGKFDIMIGGSCQKVLKTTAERTTVLKSK